MGAIAYNTGDMMKTYEIEIESTDYYTVTVETVKDIETAKEIAFQEVFEGGMSPDFTSNDLVKVKVQATISSRSR